MTAACPERFVGVVSRDATRSDHQAHAFGISVHSSVQEMVRSGAPDFTVSSVPWGVNPMTISSLAEAVAAEIGAKR